MPFSCDDSNFIDNYFNRRDLERELSRRIDISDEHEKRILELWAIEDQKIQSEKKAKKREQRAIQDRINLLERAMSLDREYQSLLLQQIEIMQKQMRVYLIIVPRACVGYELINSQ